MTYKMKKTAKFGVKKAKFGITKTSHVGKIKVKPIYKGKKK